MSGEAERMWSDAFSAARSFFDHPAVKAYYVAEAKREQAAWDREQREARKLRDDAAAEAQRAKSYDIWALNGGSDECTQFGINDGCKPHCPVFERGQCSIQEENEELFAPAQGARS